MAELTETRTEEPTASGCCPPEAQAVCCEPTDKSKCCEPESSSCGCSADEADGEEIRDAVRSRHAAAAVGVSPGAEAGASCCAPATALTDT